MSTYLTLKLPSTGSYKEKGSKFLAFAYPVTKVSEVEEKLRNLKKEHHGARHICYAYCLGVNVKETRAHDAGEPANTGGQPILDHIMGKVLTNVVVVVVRYFGGTLLGRGGLARAYSKAAGEALDKAKTVRKKLKNPLHFSLPYPQIEPVMQMAKKERLEIQERSFGNLCNFTVLIPVKDFDKILLELRRIPGFKKY